MNGRTPKQLLSLLDNHFNDADLRELARELGTNYENLAGNTKRGRFLSLIEYAEHNKKVDVLSALVVEKRPFLSEWGGDENEYRQRGCTITWQLGLTLALSIIFIGIGIILPLSRVADRTQPETQPTPADRILLQVKVVSREDQTAISNAKVSLDLSDDLFPQQRTDSKGLAIFQLPANVDGQSALITVEANGQVETQNITVTFGLRPIEFQLRP